MPNSTARTDRTYAMLTAAAVATVATAIFPLITVGADMHGLQVSARLLARLSFPVFLLAFVTSSLHTLVPSEATRWLRRHRRALGLSFGVVFGGHFLLVVAFRVAAGEPPHADVETIVGGLGFVAAAVLSATSSNRAQRALGRRWNTLHRVGSYYLWAIFTITYTGNATVDPVKWAAVVLCVAALALRGLARRQGAASAAALASS